MTTTPTPLLPCPFCGNHAKVPHQVKSEIWGQYEWVIACSSSHCVAQVRIIADGWKQEIDPVLNPHIPKDRLYSDRLKELRQMWNRRPLPRSVEAAALLEALTPSGQTKAAYMGEFTVPVPERDEHGNDHIRHVNVPWTTIKEIMQAIRAFALVCPRPTPSESP